MYRYLCNLVLVVLMTLAIQCNADEAKAAVTTSGCGNANVSCTLEELFLGGSFTIDGINFNSWDIFELALDTPSTPDFEDIEVIPLDDQPMNPGILYNMNSEFSVFDDRFIFLDFGFNVVANHDLPIKDNSLELIDFVFGGPAGAIFIDEDIYDSNDDFLLSKAVFADNLNGDFQLSDSVVFAPQSQIFANTFIDMFGDEVGDSVQLNSFEQRFSVIPEPASLLLVGSGLLGIIGVRRMRR